MTALRKSAVNARRKAKSERRRAKGEQRTANSEQRPLSRVGVEQPDQPESQHGYRRRRRDRQNPGPDNSPGHAPADRRKAVSGSHTDNRAGDGVGGTHWNSSQCGAEQRDGAGGLGAEAANWLQLSDLGAHGVHDAPAT